MKLLNTLQERNYNSVYLSRFFISKKEYRKKKLEEIKIMTIDKSKGTWLKSTKNSRYTKTIVDDYAYYLYVNNIITTYPNKQAQETVIFMNREYDRFKSYYNSARNEIRRLKLEKISKTKN